ncbi:MAG: sulfatase-like hydrolase/transferase [Acidobacteriota bacterium]|nr:sulfatase-like hydrolase/transferase [Acidobacteriota bacterium]
MKPLIPLLVLVTLSTAALFAQAPAARHDRPSVVLIITDDAGYGDFGSYGAPDIRTPNIDSLAKTGTRFTDFYANASTCTPTRAGLISGRYQQRFAMERPLSIPRVDGEFGLPATAHSLPRLLANHGYATGLVGKWHLGYKPEFSPGAHGFGYFFGLKAGYGDYYQHTDSDGHPDLYENEAPVKVAGYMTDLITERSLKFIADRAAQPFFLEVAYTAPHWPYQVPDLPSVAIDNSRHVMPYDEKPDTRADYVKMVERVDRGVGEILAALDQLGLSRNTIVIFTNDNGGEWLSRNAPLTHRKFTLWEGGIRVPTLIRWPGRVPAGRVTPQVGITMDLSASILAATGSPVPAEARLDGINLFPILEGRTPVVERSLFWRVQTGGLDQRAVRNGDMKLLIDGTSRYLLFNVRKDLGEHDDLSQQQPAVVRRLRQQLLEWEKDVDTEAKAGGSAR